MRREKKLAWNCIKVAKREKKGKERIEEARGIV
jgi:hypothetical protein